MANFLKNWHRSGLIRSGRHFWADLGERFVADYWKVSLPDNTNKKGWDVLTLEGERIQVKTQWHNGFNRKLAIGAGFATITEYDFDAVVMVLLDDQLEVHSAWHAPQTVVLSLLDEKNRLYRKRIVNHSQCWNYPIEN